MSFAPIMPPFGQSDRFMLPPELRSTLGRFQMQGPLPVPQMPGGMDIAPGPRQKQSLWEKMQEVVSPYPQHLKGMVGPDDVKGARNQGLMALGASLLESSGPSTQRTSLGQAIGRGAQAGMGAYQGAVDSMTQRAMARQQMESGAQGMDFNRMKMEGLKGDMERIKKLDAARQGILQKHGPLPEDPEARQGYLTSVMNDLIAAGDIDSARAISEVLKSRGNEAKAPGTYVTVPGPDGKPMRRWVSQEEAARGVPEYQEPTRDAGARLLDEQRMFTRANMLGDDYRSSTASIQKAADQYRTLVSAAEGAKAGIPASQIALVFSYMKTLDPTSVVRESEYATAENARGVPESVRNQYNKVLQGARLTPKQVDDFVNQGKTTAKEWKRQQDHLLKTFNARAQRARVNEGDVTVDWFDGLDFSAPAAPTGPARFNLETHLPPRSR
jgi:hypothetical protein